MKTILYHLSFVFFLIYPLIATNSQDIVIPSTKEELRDITFSNYLNRIEGNIDEERVNVTTFSGSFLNQFFQGEINSFFTSTNDLSVENYFLSTDTDQGTLTIGASMSSGDIRDLFRKKKSLVKDFYRLKHLWTLYAKSNIANNFATISSKNKENDKFEFNSGIGMGIRYTLVGKGTVRFNKSDGYKFRSIRENQIRKKINAAIEDYLKKEFPDELKKNILDKKLSRLAAKKINFSTTKIDEIQKILDDTDVPEKEIEKSLIEKKYFDFLQKIIDEELKLMKEDKLYNGFNTRWWSTELFVPFTKQSVNVAPDNSTSFEAQEFRDWRFSSGLNFLFGTSDKTVFNFAAIGSVFNNNNFIAQNTSATSFQEITSTVGNLQVLGTNTKVFVGNYDEFTSVSLEAEAGFLYKGIAGLSASIERTFDKFDTTNWKLAVPFSLKDKDDKPTVNFEIQWRETFGEHLVGIGVGYVFGRFIK